MSGNGVAIPNQPDIIIGGGNGLPPIVLPAGTGGGCVTSGPFKDMSVNMGPVNLDQPGGVVGSNPAGPLAYNPRCLKRDLTTKINQRFANATAILSNILIPQDIDIFQMQMQGVPGSGNIGIHGGGHYSMGGDPGRDFFVSPSDPAFYLHHSMIDRVWWIWQLLSARDRTQGPTAVAGTRTFMNNPPSANTTIEDIIDIGFAGGPALPIKDLLSTTSGPFCYIYL
jgi:tyrosinase